ncbi:hypothetical protein LWI29_000373 [Acer saccharum]|uniref:Leucine-rich repeat-containing N-terminal plant-type domain-containing protein n=1 Tax=Acer saccharum TaxID=4024 RepID=A0AA39SG89_ACESA|nr:hypothetical protein LWI29_000373 [Acer saccharum]
MGVKRSSRACNDWKICAEVFVGIILIWAATNSFAATNPVDVAAINRLFAALGFPQLPGWVQSGGDPCLEAWQGVQCSASDIITIILNGANLGGELGDSLGDFASITVLSLNNNLLSGEIPDAFESLTGLINLDLSSNNLSGQLPPTLENLSPLTTLNIENNLFSGTIPDKMLQGITNFRKDGNPCNTPPTSLVTPPPPPSQSQHRPGKQDGPSACDESKSGRKKFLTTKELGQISIAGGVSFVILASVVGMAIGRVWPSILGPTVGPGPGPTVGPGPGPETKYSYRVRIMLEPDPEPGTGTGTGTETKTKTKTETGIISDPLPDIISDPLPEIISDTGSGSESPTFLPPCLLPPCHPTFLPPCHLDRTWSIRNF